MPEPEDTDRATTETRASPINANNLEAPDRSNNRGEAAQTEASRQNRQTENESSNTETDNPAENPNIDHCPAKQLPRQSLALTWATLADFTGTDLWNLRSLSSDGERTDGMEPRNEGRNLQANPHRPYPPQLRTTSMVRPYRSASPEDTDYLDLTTSPIAPETETAEAANRRDNTALDVGDCGKQVPSPKGLTKNKAEQRKILQPIAQPLPQPIPRSMPQPMPIPQPQL